MAVSTIQVRQRREMICVGVIVLVCFGQVMMSLIKPTENKFRFSWSSSSSWSTETKEQRRDVAQQVPAKEYQSDGCGLGDGTKSQWVPYTAEETAKLDSIRQCHFLFPRNERENTEHRKHLTLTSLKCDQQVTLDDVRSMVQQYDRIWFIGDSIMRQQYITMLCMLDSNVTEPPLLSVDEGPKDDNWFTTFPYIKGLFQNASEPSKQPTADTDSAIAALHNTTILRYSSFGWLFDKTQGPLYKRAFPTAVRTSTARDAIVMNAAVHYDTSANQFLEDTAQFIVKMSQESQAPIFFMEATDEQWPTSNGMYTVSCMWSCQCEALTSDRINGRGVPRDYGIKKSNLSNDVGLVPLPSKDFFGRIYPELFYNASSFYSTYNTSTKDCVPYCLPANWRTKVANPILLSSSSNQSDISVVPIWNQLVSRGIPHMRKNGDCTHKSVDALMVMMEQLTRSMMS